MLWCGVRLEFRGARGSFPFLGGALGGFARAPAGVAVQVGCRMRWVSCATVQLHAGGWDGRCEGCAALPPQCGSCGRSLGRIGWLWGGSGSRQPPHLGLSRGSTGGLLVHFPSTWNPCPPHRPYTSPTHAVRASSHLSPSPGCANPPLTLMPVGLLELRASCPDPSGVPGGRDPLQSSKPADTNGTQQHWGAHRVVPLRGTSQTTAFRPGGAESCSPPRAQSPKITPSCAWFRVPPPPSGAPAKPCGLHHGSI